MSTGFRIFLLMLFAFGAIWVYRYRSLEFAEWLWPAPSTVAQEPDPTRDPSVDGVVGNELDMAWIRLHGRRFTSPSGAVPNPYRRWNPSPEEYGGELTPEQERAMADLPVEEGDPETIPSPPVEDGTGLEDEGRVVDDGFVEEGGSAEESSEAESPEEEGGAVAREEFIYEFQAGDSLWKLAEKFLGSGVRYREIHELNRDVLTGVKLDRIPLGTKLRIPRKVGEESLKKPRGETDRSVEADPARDAEASRQRVVSHTVKRNETLATIARRYYPEDSTGWRIIFEANDDRLDSPDTVREGQVLRIPLGAARVR